MTGGDFNARPSLLWTQHSQAHREHEQHPQHQQKYHSHFNHPLGSSLLLSGRLIATSIKLRVIEVVATVSMVQEVHVDTNGSTISMKTVLATSFTGTSADHLTPVAAITPTPGASAASSTRLGATRGTAIRSISSPVQTSSSIYIQATANPSTLPLQPSPNHDLSTSAPSMPTKLASLFVTTNSTILIPSSALNFSHFTNSSASTTSWTTPTISPLSISQHTKNPAESDSTTTSSASPLPAASTSLNTDGGGVGAASSGGSPSSTATYTGGIQQDPPHTPSTSTIVGSVLGGVASLAIILFIVMLLLRWKQKGNQKPILSLKSGNAPKNSEAIPGTAATSVGDTARRISGASTAFAHLLGYKRNSEKTDGTISLNEAAEPAFYRVSGRKLPSVFQHGGDGFGEPPILNGSPFSRDSHAFFGRAGSSSNAILAEASSHRKSGIPVIRPSPARTPVTEQGFSAHRAPLDLPPGRPEIGRSSFSASSHTSRFTEEV